MVTYKIKTQDVDALVSCADPGIFARLGVQAGLPENSSDNVFLFFSVLTLFYSFTEYIGCLMVISKEIFQGFRGSSTFSGGGGQLFPGKGGGFKYANFYIETHKTCDFQGVGVHSPYPTLDPRMSMPHHDPFTSASN